MPLLLNACPSFTEKWASHSAYWEDNRENETLLYIDLSEFSQHLIELHKSNQIDEFPAVFEVVEKLHLEGDDYVKEAATIGLLEGIQNEILDERAEYQTRKTGKLNDSALEVQRFHLD